MASRTIDDEIDKLYQLPLEQFTPARNALAKGAGSDAKRIKALTKPPVAAWAVNQLFWHHSDVWKDLSQAAERARAVHRAVLSGKGGDVRAAGKAHEEALDRALTGTLDLLLEGGHPVTDTTRQAIVTTLRALPGDDPPGRLSRVLQPGGFEMLAGLSIGARSKIAKMPKAVAAPSKPAGRPSRAGQALPPKPKVDARALARARHALAGAHRGVREAETAVKRADFERARAEREAERTAKAAEAAREALREAVTQARAAAAALTSARDQSHKAEADLKRIEAPE